VLIPRHLIENLSESQLRAVLLHELSHVRRGDLRVNSLQTLLQIFYWWNPLLWLANAHIRRVREQTVDELVMVTLDADAGTYPATLLEVAKVSFTRPALSLGLIGIVESKSALKRRITRLLDREVPRSAKLGFGSTLTILLAALLLLPMAQGQLKRAPSVAAAPQADADRTTVVNVMVQFVELPDAAIAQLELGEPSVRTGNGHFAWRLSADQLGKIGRQFKDRTDVTILASPRVTARSGTQTRIEVSEPSPGDSFTLATNKGSITPACDLTPQVNRAQIDLDIVARITESGTVAADPNGQLGLLPLRIKDAELEKASDGAVYSVNAIGYIKYDVGTARVTVGDGEGIVLQNPELKNTRGNRYVVLVSPKMDRSQESAGAPTDGPLNSAGAAGSQLAQALATRTYRVNPAVFLERLRAVSGTFPGTNTQELVRTFFESAGVGSQPPNAIFFSDQTGMLMIRAPVEESDLALQLINQLQPAPAQVTIETRFLELPSDAAAKLGLDLPLVTARSNNWTRVLTAEQMSKALTAAEQLNGVDVLTAPKVTTLSGRQTQIQITEIQTIVSGIKPEAFSGEGIRSSNGVEAQPMITSQVPVGPILNLIPRVGDDGYTIRLFAVPTCEEFLGYDTNEADEVQIRVDGKEEKVVMPMPRFRKRLMHASAAVYDGQTLVLGCPTRTLITKRRDGTSERTSIAEEPDKRLLVFVTATIIDPAGNRVHAPGNLPFPENEVPRSKPLDRQ
jgi:type II secretory pathway component GspD/PulD (secretin)